MNEWMASLKKRQDNKEDIKYYNNRYSFNLKRNVTAICHILGLAAIPLMLMAIRATNKN